MLIIRHGIYQVVFEINAKVTIHLVQRSDNNGSTTDKIGTHFARRSCVHAIRTYNIICMRIGIFIQFGQISCTQFAQVVQDSIGIKIRHVHEYIASVLVLTRNQVHIRRRCRCRCCGICQQCTINSKQAHGVIQILWFNRFGNVLWWYIDQSNKWQ